MLQPAHVGHLAMLRSLIRQGAQDGSFDRELGASSPEAEAFFAKLKRALVTGYFVEEGRSRQASTRSRCPVTCSGPTTATPAPSPWASACSARSRAATSCGWPGLDLGARGGGHGRALLAALFATAQGQKTWVVRVQRGSRYVGALQHLLADFGFELVGDTPRLRWFLRTDAPAELASRVRDAVDARSALN